MKTQETAEIDGTIVHETDGAYLVEVSSGDKVWLPKSQVEWDMDNDIFIVPEWLAIEKDLA
jgi:hypothetical protein